VAVHRCGLYSFIRFTPKSWKCWIVSVTMMWCLMVHLAELKWVSFMALKRFQWAFEALSLESQPGQLVRLEAPAAQLLVEVA
jgi:hypothetical protein